MSYISFLKSACAKPYIRDEMKMTVYCMVPIHVYSQISIAIDYKSIILTLCQ